MLYGPVDNAGPSKLQTYIYFKCTQDDQVQCKYGFRPGPNGYCMYCKKSTCGAYEHRQNFCVVHKVCSSCLEKDVNQESSCDNCGANELVFKGEDTTKAFCSWLFSGINKGPTVLCHNFKGYDSVPILQYLYKNGGKPTIIPNGGKNMSIEVPRCKIRMIDSLNFLLTALSKIPKMIGFTELHKGYFPHLYNRK